MQRTTTLLQKIADLVNKEASATAIDVDLAMDYTRVLYADLMEWRSRVAFNNSLSGEVAPPQPAPQPTVPDAKMEEEIQAPVLPDLTVPSQAEMPVPIVADTSAVVTEKTNADIRKSIGINDKYQFISELFGNDKEAYEEVLNEVNSAAGYDEAVDQLDEVHTSRNWNDEDVTVQSFYGILSQFFSER